jgi:hypothetical protein
LCLLGEFLGNVVKSVVYKKSEKEYKERTWIQATKAARRKIRL